jgi:hypothetical protein
MKLNESYKNRIKSLAGINNVLVENQVTLTAEGGGRSDENTLSWFIEEYLLKLGTSVVNTLDKLVDANPESKLLLSKGSTKITSNNLVIKLIIKNTQKSSDEEFLLTLSVDLETTSNTVCAVKYKGVINKFNLSSKHSSSDLNLFISEITDYILNSIKLTSEKK